MSTEVGAGIETAGQATAAATPTAAGGSPGHVIVCGLRGIGLRIVEQLHRSGEAVIVLEEHADSTTVAVLAGWGVTAVAPFGSAAQTLTVAGIRGQGGRLHQQSVHGKRHE